VWRRQDCFTTSSLPRSSLSTASVTNWRTEFPWTHSCHLPLRTSSWKAEELALRRAACKPTCWFRYMDNTFVIWPHGPGELMSSSTTSTTSNLTWRLNRTATFYSWTMTRTVDQMALRGTLCTGHTPTHTNLYLNTESRHHPANKHSVLSILVKRNPDAWNTSSEKWKRLSSMLITQTGNKFSPWPSHWSRWIKPWKN
jgi:hypothetical protein